MAFVTSREITPQLLGLLGGAVDESVDCLAAHGPRMVFVSGFQPACNLLGRPPFCEAVENEAPQISVDMFTRALETHDHAERIAKLEAQR